MKQKWILGIIALFSVAIMQSCNSAASKPSEYHVSYDVTFPEEGNEVIEMLKAQGIKPTMDVYVADGKSKVEMDMSMMQLNVVMNSADSQAIMLISAMGQNMAVNVNKDDYKKFVDYQESDYGEVTITEETKEIAGYSCTLAKVESKGTTVDIWFTKDLAAQGLEGSGYQFGIDGCPLEMQINAGGIMLNFVASKVDLTKPGEGTFDMTIPEGYQEVTVDQLNEM